MKFTKMHGSGNDYLFIDARDPSIKDADWPALSQAMSDRHFGVGGDGIILIMPSDVAHLRMRMFNADGSEGEMCGNGIRCFAKYAIERDIAQPGDSGLHVETLAGIRTIVPVIDRSKVVRARVAMGAPHLEHEEVPVALPSPAQKKVGSAVVDYPVEIGGVSLNLSFVSMGNPHAVAFIQQPVDEFPLHTIGPQVERHPMFPRRVNFEIVNVLSSDHLRARVWERGSGETMACGTGACGIAVASRLLGLTGDSVDITLPGGTLNISWDGQGEVYMEGDAVEVFEGEWRD
jgi:diaminopimelate epimerase